MFIVCRVKIQSSVIGCSVSCEGSLSLLKRFFVSAKKKSYSSGYYFSYLGMYSAIYRVQIVLCGITTWCQNDENMISLGGGKKKVSKKTRSPCSHVSRLTHFDGRIDYMHGVNMLARFSILPVLYPTVLFCSVSIKLQGFKHGWIKNQWRFLFFLNKG